MDLACVEQAYTGEQAAQDAAAKRGFVLLPRRGVVERRQGWAAQCRRLSWHDEQ